MATRKQAPRVEFSQALFTRICGLIANGKSLREACELKGMPDRTTFNEWRKRSPKLQAEYDQACKDQEDATFDDIQYIADTEPDARRAAVKIDARKWRLKIRNRKVFGDKVDANVSGADGGPLQIEIVRFGAADGEDSAS
jgi:hypothetical protein